MSTPDGPIPQFFRQFTFQKYSYNPHAPAPKEFKRLCEARQWGPSKIRRHEAVFRELILEVGQDPSRSSAGPEVTKFFRRYEYQNFACDLDAPAQSEFQRLIGLRGWGKKKLSGVKKEFKNAVALDAREQSMYGSSQFTGPEYQGPPEVDLLADWLREQECPGYRYRGDLPELEFKELVYVKRREWLRRRYHEIGEDRPLTTEERQEWKTAPEFESLRDGFYAVVEEVFNLLLENFCQITGLTPWQVLVGLYGEGQGQGASGKQAAKNVLQKVFINIFDFLDAFQEILRNPPTTDGRELLRQLKPRASELQFPNNLMLGVYSALTNRVFPKEAARENGTLVLLLHRIKLYLQKFDAVMRDFMKEAGDELKEAEEEGRVGIRRLLLSRNWASLGSLKSALSSAPY
ncbi:hypothetical protein C7212DRAFT_347014 [Tuber magnatum]|uniref:Uncharacterized protein n=1 Tax=Tuber magnatum TaxID=42249 RepID=A0A317SJX9_9PEZI|nr:hypothetical protein C7212DRAFT_347014 [Tuber magnatum]